MATNKYTQYYHDGTSRYVRRITRQGRPRMPDSIRRDRRVIASVTQSTRDKLDAVISDALTESNIVEDALLMWLDQYAINCTINRSIS